MEPQTAVEALTMALMNPDLNIDTYDGCVHAAQAIIKTLPLYGGFRVTRWVAVKGTFADLPDMDE